MKPYAWIVIGALVASVGWMLVVALVCNAVGQLRWRLRRTEAALEAANVMVSDTMAQSGRMARLVIRPCRCSQALEGDET
jgi:hypothetical protein